MTHIIDTNGVCPYCERTFDANKAIPAFPVTMRNKILVLEFALCPKCYGKFRLCNKEQQGTIIVDCIHRLANNIDIGWTVTTNLALCANSGHFFNAWWKGTGLPRVVLDAINDGLVDEITILPAFVGVI